MKSAYVICAILGMTIGTLVLAQNGTVQTTPIQVPKPSIPPSSAESSKNIADSGFKSVPPTTAEPSPSTTHESTTLSTSTVIITTTTNAPITATTNATTATPNKTTTTSPITTNIPTTPTPTSPKPKPTSPAPEPTATPTNEAKTTPIPPSSKDRQFDGLSFFGGIVLTTCLMAIAAFSWRFYRQCKEGNYRTL